ncbi:hypothetical protein [Brevibacillus sp. AG162]|uniref:hypothetical protein n=1 Tax=Brevibacillus sp. AG162 TaxID=2572910 RepID=UPI00114DB69A|nr:hypothetical protein [Brevibacillus sp. AG162]
MRSEEKGKPNNKIVLNFSQKIIDLGTSHIASNPIRYSPNEAGFAAIGLISHGIVGWLIFVSTLRSGIEQRGCAGVRCASRAFIYNGG